MINTNNEKIRIYDEFKDEEKEVLDSFEKCGSDNPQNLIF